MKKMNSISIISTHKNNEEDEFPIAYMNIGLKGDELNYPIV